MRLWSLHPSYLDRAGLLALWREALLAQKVLAGGTRGYRSHPQLARFRAHPEPLLAIAVYLHHVWLEGKARGYRFDDSKILMPASDIPAIEVAIGQLRFELLHLRSKLEARDPGALERLRGLRTPEPHPLFKAVDGPIEEWERTRRD